MNKRGEASGGSEFLEQGRIFNVLTRRDSPVVEPWAPSLARAGRLVNAVRLWLSADPARIYLDTMLQAGVFSGAKDEYSVVTLGLPRLFQVLPKSRRGLEIQGSLIGESTWPMGQDLVWASKGIVWH